MKRLFVPLVLTGLCFQPAQAGAQCIGDLSADLVGMGRVVDALVEEIGSDTLGRAARAKARETVTNLAIFASGASAGGGLSASCLVARQEQFSQAATVGLDAATTDSLQVSELRNILYRATAAALSDRYQSSDRFQVFFAVGFAAALDSQDIEKFKIVKRTGTPSDGQGTASDTSLVVRESNSGGVPAALTGVLIRFRDLPAPGSGKRQWRGLPSSFFASAQLSTGDVGVINGAALGLGWRIVGGANLLLGFSLARVQSLREDLREDWDKAPNHRLVLKAGETEESIKGTETANFINIAIAVPISFGSSLGGGG